MANENEELDGMNFDADALNAGLNSDQETESESETETEEVETESEEQEQESESEGTPSPRQATAEERRYQKLANERKAAREEKQQEREQRLLAEQRATLLEQQIAELRRGAPPVDDNLDPLEKWQRDANLQLQRSQFQNQDMLDRTQFLLKVTQKPALSSYAEQVEKRLHEIRLKGGNPSRDQVLTVIIGEQAMKKMDEAPAIKREAAARVKAATGKPLGTKSNVAPSKSDNSTEYDRLKDIQL